MRGVITISIAITLIFCYCKKDKKGMPSVTTTVASNITANSLSTGGNVTDDGGQTVTKRGICWADHAGPTVADSITSDGSGGGSFTSSINGLNANTNYYIKAYASNASGTAYGNEVMVTTSKGVPVVTTTAVTDIQPLTAKTGGNVMNDGGATVTERGVVYATTPNPTTANTKIAAGTGTGSYTTSLTPLASQQTYYVRAYAVNSYGTGYGKQLQFNAASANTVTDIEGNVYPYITLCDGKSWMASNLKTTKYKNGDLITNGLSGFTWAGTTLGAFTFPNGEVKNKDSFGLLYNEWVIADSRGVCPSGWHVPTDAEWQAVEVCNGMDPGDASVNGERGIIGSKFLEGGTTGMNIRKAGAYQYFLNPPAYVVFGQNGEGDFWTSSPSPSYPNGFRMRAFNPYNNPNPILRQSSGNQAISIRCVKD